MTETIHTGVSWSLLLRGICGVLFAGVAFFLPGLTIEILVLWFGAYALLDGILAVVSTFRAIARHARWWLFLLEGIAGIAVGVMTFAWPGNTAVVLVILVAAWALVTGVLETAAAFTVPWTAKGRWLLGLSGALSVALGVLMAAFPAVGALYLVWLLGAYALLFGILFMVLGLKHRQLPQLQVVG